MTSSLTRHHYATVLRAAEAGVDDMERMLGVARLMLNFCTDLLCQKPGKEPAAALNDILETHQVNRFTTKSPAGTSQSADAVVHEVCSPHEQIYFQVCFSNTQPGPGAGRPLASLQMVLQPAAHQKSSRFISVKAVKIKLQGHCTVHLEAAQETYNIELPSLLVNTSNGSMKTTALTGNSATVGALQRLCCPSLQGNLQIECAASRLRLQLAFEAKHAVTGQVLRQGRGRQQAVAHITGHWSDRISVSSHAMKAKEPALQGVLFKSQQQWGSDEPTVDLEQPAEMKLAGLWLCIKDSLQHAKLAPSTQPLSSRAESYRTGQLRFGLEHSLTTKEDHPTVAA